MIHAVGTALGEIIQNLRRTVRLTLYENRSRRAGMLLGRWWDLLSPLLQILIYWFVFSVGLGTQEKNGFPYHLWLMCGMMPWLALNSAILGASASIQQAASIIRNVRIPLSIIPMKAVVRAYYEHLWTMAILLIALLLGGVPVTWHYLELAYYLAASWVLLIGAIICLAASFFLRDALGEFGFIDGFRLRTGNPGECGCRYHAALALLGFFASCSQRAKLLHDAGYREADDDQPGDCKAEQHDSRYHLAEQRQAAPRDARTDIAAASGKLIGQEKIVRSIRGSFGREQRQ